MWSTLICCIYVSLEIVIIFNEKTVVTLEQVKQKKLNCKKKKATSC